MVTPTTAAIEITLLVVLVQTSGASGSTASGTPTPRTSASIPAKSPSGSHWFQTRKGSAIARVAKSTHARTTQLKTVPK